MVPDKIEVCPRPDCRFGVVYYKAPDWPWCYKCGWEKKPDGNPAHVPSVYYSEEFLIRVLGPADVAFLASKVEWKDRVKIL